MLTCAMFKGARLAVPLKIISTMDAERNAFQLISPIVQRTESITLDLPHPFGPTTQVIPGSKSRRDLSANDLNPIISIAFKYITSPLGRYILIIPFPYTIYKGERRFNQLYAYEIKRLEEQ